MSSARSLLIKVFVVAPVLFAGIGAARAPGQSPGLSNSRLLHLMDPDMARVILFYETIRGTPAVKLTPQDARQQLSPQEAEKIIVRYFGISPAPLPVASVTDGATIPSRDGTQIPVRLYTPAGAGPFPVVVYFHGGGFVIATIDTYDGSARALANDAKAIVVSVEYRKAPEAPYPAALHDAIDAYKWVTANIAIYNGNPRKVAVAGESAGGNLATEVAIAARDQGFQAPAHQLLIYPVVSSNVTQPSDLLYTSSLLPLNTALLQYFFKNYVTDPAEGTLPGVAPLIADLHNLPPTTILAAELDPLVSDGQAYAAKLQASGVQVVYQLYSGTTHEFFGMGDYVAKARAAELFGAARLAASF